MPTVIPRKGPPECRVCGANDRNASGHCRPCQKRRGRERQMRRAEFKRMLKNRRRTSPEARRQILEWAEATQLLGTLTDLCKRLGVKYNTARWMIEHEKLRGEPERAGWDRNRISLERKIVN